MRIARWLRTGLWALALIVGVAVGWHTAALDSIVRDRFEGRLFRVPSRVLSAPSVLYPGMDWELADLRGALARLGYRPKTVDGPLAAGRFRWTRELVEIHRRRFQHPTREEPALRVRVHLSGARIDRIEDSDGRELRFVALEPELVGAYFGPERAQRELVSVDELPEHTVGAILAVEDRRFFSHWGVDPVRVAGAFVVNLQSGRVVQGGSTLTQQLVKNFFLTPERSLTRKIQEAWMALIVEARYSKSAILESYLNEIYLGQRGATAIHGIGEASRHYFGKAAADLSLAESALLASLVSSPNGRSPYRHPEEALSRRNLAIERMSEEGLVDAQLAVAAIEEPLGLAQVTPAPREARWFLDFLRRQLPEFYDSAALTHEGLRIYSTLDLRLQRLGARVVREGLEKLESDNPKLAEAKTPLQACLVALRPQTGEVLALIGGRDYGRSQFDRCTQARRQVGSAFKPFVYAAALEPIVGGPTITLATLLDDNPLAVPSPGGKTWRPANYDRSFHGHVRPPEALARSLNVATARLGLAVGPERMVEVARRLGIESPLPQVPSLALGSADLSPLEVARAYATLGNGGVRPELRAFEDVVDATGARVERQAIDSQRVLDPGTAFLVTELLQGVVDRGTGRRIRSAGIRGPVAGKTGTTNDLKDAWFAGFTPELAVVVWVGFDEPRSIGLAASRAALPIWTDFLLRATGGEVAGRFVPPPEVARVEIDPVSGARALADCPRREPTWFVRGTGPEAVCPSWEMAAPSREPASSDNRRRPKKGKESPAGFWLDRVFDRWLGRD
ncbi:MAG: PBP1A family penicillin-binding protein, partial [Myxococcota bacterium]